MISRLHPIYLSLAVTLLTAISATARDLPASLTKHAEGLVAFWDFNEEAGQPRLSHGAQPYALKEMKGPIKRSDAGGVFGPYAARIKPGQWFMIDRPDLRDLNIHGKEAKVSVVAWVKRVEKSFWQAIAGVWDETRGKRQYCLFLNAPTGTRADEMKRYPLANRIHGHVSSVGGGTPGQKVCITYSSSATEIPLGEWHCLAMTYDGRESRVYLDGKLDSLEQYNPFPYTEGLFDGGAEGSPFTVGAVHRSGTWGNFFGGVIGGLAVYKRALNEAEMLALAQSVPLPPPTAKAAKAQEPKVTPKKAPAP
ncbi:LamG domain-containing protein [Brevifollis gellanilyticus]|uniref:LamG-like jellyroll fold domain-containing protein n=1 Tax=Brevifollis gellanilyticus TaxID=748831 RepID=A0A512MAI9_9BACT|nr:LamG domain-containing protein [Brevifollis gellanilyticus]GEP43757.1 hypothetical protein BGE01nite_30480 [Brevifollis gellanilyticus]